MGWFSNDEPDVVDFEAVIARGVVWPAYTDENGVLVIDVDYDVEVLVDEAIVDGFIYPAWVDEWGQLRIDMD
ncbi:hypothetical protein [Streptacidiphilus anmyonensis]|uniref:hypothetical protein n=1 Tax=Streptacidiphilus anmyonensis TaxID=405782 RepID=UPI0005A619F3|nr:hypothetical protein [Streptacidiphilus anmyonensis]